MDEQSKKCVECQACCRYSLTPINPQHDHLKLLWLKRVPLYYNIESRYWSLYTESNCRYIDKEKGCLAYDKPELKAELCPKFMCHQKDKTHWVDIKEGIVETQKLLDAMFGEENNGETISSDNGSEV